MDHDSSHNPGDAAASVFAGDYDPSFDPPLRQPHTVEDAVAIPSAAQQYLWACETLRIIWVLYGVCLAVLFSLASSDHVAALRTGWWFGWQMLVLPAILAPRVETVDGGQLMGAVDLAHTCAGSAAPFVVRMSPRIAVVYTYARIAVWASISVCNSAFFLFHLTKCFSHNCTSDPDASCCKEGNLYVVSLGAALIGAALGLFALWALWRVPRSPTFYLADPLNAAVATPLLPPSSSSRVIAMASAGTAQGPLNPAATLTRRVTPVAVPPQRPANSSILGG